MADIAVVRKRVRFAIEQARRDQAERRQRAADASTRYAAFLDTAAVPAFRAVATVLKAEGVPCDVMTPSGAVTLVSERRRDDAVSLELDTSVDPPEPLVTVTFTRGSRSVQSERPVKADTPLAQLTEDDVVDMLLEVLRPWLT